MQTAVPTPGYPPAGTAYPGFQPSSNFAGALAGYGSDVWWSYPKAFAEVTSTPPWADDATSLAALEGSTLLSPHRGGGIGLEAVEQARWQGLARALNAAAASGRVEELLCHPLGEFSLNKGY